MEILHSQFLDMADIRKQVSDNDLHELMGDKSEEKNYGMVAGSKDLNDLIREDAEDYALLAEILPLAYCALTLDEIIRKKLIPTELTERAKHGLYVTVGFDEGQHLDLSRIE